MMSLRGEAPQGILIAAEGFSKFRNAHFGPESYVTINSICVLAVLSKTPISSWIKPIGARLGAAQRDARQELCVGAFHPDRAIPDRRLRVSAGLETTGALRRARKPRAVTLFEKCIMYYVM